MQENDQNLQEIKPGINELKNDTDSHNLSYHTKSTNQMTSEFLQNKCHNQIFHGIAVFLMRWITDKGLGLSLGFFVWFVDYRDGAAITFGIALQEIINGCLK